MVCLRKSLFPLLLGFLVLTAATELTIEDEQEKQPETRDNNFDDEFEDLSAPTKGKEVPTEDENEPAKDSPKYHEKEYNASQKPRAPFSLYEILMIVLLAVYILNVYWGKGSNDLYAQQWFAANRDFYLDNYALVGISNADNSQSMILKESYSAYKFYASGRVNCKSLLISIDLKKRHDLVSLLSSILFFQEKDRINFEFALEPNSDIPTVFCLCKPKDLKQLKKSYSDLEFFTKTYSRYFQSERLYLYAEHPTIFTDIFEKKEVMAAYRKIEDCLDLIYYTDRKTFSRESNAIYISFDLPAGRKNINQKFRDISEFVHYFIDEFCLTRFSEKDRKQSEQNRVEFERQKIKEMADKQSEEIKSQRQKKEEEKRKNMTREQLQRLEEKEKERELKKLQHKKVKMIKY